MDFINKDYVTNYLSTVLPKREGLFQRMEEDAAKHNIPIVQREVACLLDFLAGLKRPKNILEIGTAIGYSGLILAQNMQEDGRMVTIELRAEMADKARKNFEIAGFSDRIRVIEGDALEVLPCLNQKFDFIFIDAAKGHYMEFFEHTMRLLAEDGIIVSDNVLYRGMTATDELVVRRQRTIVGRMRRYLKMLCSHEELRTAVLAVGDGVALSQRIKKVK